MLVRFPGACTIETPNQCKNFNHERLAQKLVTSFLPRTRQIPGQRIYNYHKSNYWEGHNIRNLNPQFIYLIVTTKTSDNIECELWSLIRRSECLIVTIIEKYGDRKWVRGLRSPVYLGEGDLVGGGAGVAVEMDVSAEVEGGGKHHHARVVHPLPVLPLPAGQVRQATFLAEKDDIYHVLLDILG